jgi:hypothetical protein
MRRAAAIIFALVALSWSVEPLLACIVPERAMTPQERECCRHMADMCGSEEMPQSHTCCKTEVRLEINVVIKVDPQSPPNQHVLAMVPIATSSPYAEVLELSKQHRPPGEFPADTTVLRI